MTARRRIAIGTLAVFVVCALCAIAAARPGGGDSFSGGGGHSSGGGGGGGAFVILELVWYLFQLVLYYPFIGVPLILGIIGWVAWSSYKQNKNKDWDSGPAATLSPAAPTTALRQIDPEFSPVVFEDFAFRLFSTAHRARASADQLATVAPYVSEGARTSLAQREPTATPVKQVIVGALRTIDTDIDDTDVTLAVELEANVMTAAHTYYSVERWWFKRAKAVHSKPPGVSRTFRCPNCGAPWQASASGTQVCASCNQVVDNGRFDWVVDSIELASQDERPPSLTKEVEERGTDLATYKSADRDAKWDALIAADPTLTEATFERRVQMIYDMLNKGWASNDLEVIRGFVTDGLFDYLQYWIEAYKREGLRNQLTDMRITKVDYAKVSRDKYYDAVTIRIWGTGKDFVVRGETGQVVRGSKRVDRAYSEYWTLIRSAGKRGAPKAEPTCGNCGAPLHVTQSGECEHCGAHVTGGEFDWVLSKIEQDDTYRG
ncbi:MAG: TIM44-like domain-containing protein [Deltaproteobacteria bacterium]